MAVRKFKGQTYSLIAILIIIPIFIFISFFMISTQEESITRIDKIIADQQHQLSESIENDFERAMEISARRAFVAASNEVITSGQALDDSILRIEELMVDGTLYGNTSVIMSNNTLEDWRQKILVIGSEFNKSLEYADFGVIDCCNGITMIAKMRIIMNISDKQGIARIDRDIDKSVRTGPGGIEDPMFPLNSWGLATRLVDVYDKSPYYTRKILAGSTRMGNCSGNVTFDPDDSGGDKILVVETVSQITSTSFEGLVLESSEEVPPEFTCYIKGYSGAVDLINYTTNIMRHGIVYLDEKTGLWSLPLAQNLEKYFLVPDGGPSYLKRLEGDFSSSSPGVDTFIWDDPNIPDKPGQSRVAYLYFSNQTHTGYQVRGFPNSFILDPATAGRYNMTELLEGYP